jgi:hypothetical protein
LFSAESCHVLEVSYTGDNFDDAIDEAVRRLGYEPNLIIAAPKTEQQKCKLGKPLKR